MEWMALRPLERDLSPRTSNTSFFPTQTWGKIIGQWKEQRKGKGRENRKVFLAV